MPRSMSRYSACNRNCYSMCSMDCNNLRSKAICTQFRSSRASICSWSKWDDMPVPGGQVEAPAELVEPAVEVVVLVVPVEVVVAQVEPAVLVEEVEGVAEEPVEGVVPEEVVEEWWWLRWQ